MLPFLILISTIEKYYSTSIETAEQYNDININSIKIMKTIFLRYDADYQYSRKVLIQEFSIHLWNIKTDLIYEILQILML